MSQDSFNSFEQAEDFLLQTIDYEKLTQYKYDTTSFDLSRMEEMMSFVGCPQKENRYVHISGTKGKGSTSIIIASILKELGLKTGLFTSPHLIYLGERMKVDGRMISKKTFVHLISKLKPYIDKTVLMNPALMPTFFEIITAIAFLYFEKKSVDISVLEVGMGGRLDSTNIIEPEVTVITPVGYDHMDKLGHTLDKIAYEKAGIIKKNTPVVSSIQEPEALSTITKISKEKKSPLYLVGKDVLINDVKVIKRGGVYGTICEIKTWRNRYKQLFLPLIGRHQIENCATAIATIEVLSETGVIDTDSETIINALTKIKCPARIEVVSNNPLIVLDTAHTDASMKILKESIQETLPYKNLILIIGLSSDKDIEGVLREILSIANNLILTRTGNPREADPEQMAIIAKRFYQKEISIIEDIDEALNKAKMIADKDDLICITGSFFLAGKAEKIV